MTYDKGGIVEGRYCADRDGTCAEGVAYITVRPFDGQGPG